MGRTYVVKGISPPRGWTPKVGDQVYLEGKKTGIKRVYDSDGVPYVDFTRAVDGTVAMSIRNLQQIARLHVTPIKELEHSLNDIFGLGGK